MTAAAPAATASTSEKAKVKSVEQSVPPAAPAAAAKEGGDTPVKPKPIAATSPPPVAAAKNVDTNTKPSTQSVSAASAAPTAVSVAYRSVDKSIQRLSVSLKKQQQMTLGEVLSQLGATDAGQGWRVLLKHPITAIVNEESDLLDR